MSTASPRPPARLQNRLLWVLTASAVGIGALLLLKPAPLPGVSTETPPAVAGEPDLHMEDALITQFQQDGSVKYQLSASQIRHFEEQQVTRLTDPNLLLYQDTEPPWRITSARGFIRSREDADGGIDEEVILSDDVRMEHRTTERGLLSLHTSSITLYPDRRYATTDQNVMIESDVGRTQAVGLRGDLRRGLLELFSDATQRVHTTLLPDQFK